MSRFSISPIIRILPALAYSKAFPGFIRHICASETEGTWLKGDSCILENKMAGQRSCSSPAEPCDKGSGQKLMALISGCMEKKDNLADIQRS
jgi:hypothetical protein